MDEATKQKIQERVAERAQTTPVHLYLFGIAWIIIALAMVAGVQIPYVTTLIAFFVGVTFLYMGALISERRRMEKTFRELLEAFESFNRSIYGDDYKVKRAAVDILIRSLAHGDPTVRDRAHAQLVRLSGHDFPAEHAPWEAWWRDAKASFTGSPAERS
ncbi:MAG: hypothetical protein KDC95_07870 [Planctomycetes bacterium]|nr:hypothetical protein [Planctomycetota bacterium]